MPCPRCKTSPPATRLARCSRARPKHQERELAHLRPPPTRAAYDPSAATTRVPSVVCGFGMTKPQCGAFSAPIVTGVVLLDWLIIAPLHPPPVDKLPSSTSRHAR